MKNDSQFIPYGRQTITPDDIQEVTRVLQSPLITQGEVVPQFEQAIAHQVKAKYAIAVNSATSALHLACLALGLHDGDWLWTSPNTFVASANCGLYCGAKVDFVDIDPSTGLMSIDALSRKLQVAEQNSTLPKVVIPVHLAGTSCDMHEIAMLSKKYGFRIIEDASHAIGARYQMDPVGSCKYSDICIFSFHPVKIITTGEGGMAVTNSQDIAEKIILYRSHGITKDERKFSLPVSGPWHYEQHCLGYNYRLTDLQAALGLSQLRRLEKIIRTRNLLLNNYMQLLDGLPLKLLKIPDNISSSVHLAVVQLDDSHKSHHLKLFNLLRECGFGVQLHYAPVHLQPYYRQLGFQTNDFPNAEDYAQRSISLPLFPGLTFAQQGRVVATIKQYIDL